MIDDLINALTEITDNDDYFESAEHRDDLVWAARLADQLLASKNFLLGLGQTPSRLDLINLLLQLDKGYLQEEPNETWIEYSAKKILDFFK